MYFFNPRTLKAEDERSLSVQGQPELHSGFQTGLLVEILSQTTKTKSGGGGKLEIHIIETPKL